MPRRNTISTHKEDKRRFTRSDAETLLVTVENMSEMAVELYRLGSETRQELGREHGPYMDRTIADLLSDFNSQFGDTGQTLWKLEKLLKLVVHGEVPDES